MPAPVIHPLPDVGLTWVFGLLELLEDRGGREDGYKIARDLNFKFGDLLKVMKAAEILGFVSTPDGDVVLTPLGKQLLEAKINERKIIVREQLKKHSLFSYFMSIWRCCSPPKSRSGSFPLWSTGGVLPSCSAITRMRIVFISITNKENSNGN